jgi:hypothetical protein
MALGAPIGFSARLTQNNRRDGLYHNQMNNGAAQIHIALMGDPTLRMHVVPPPGTTTAFRQGSVVTLAWQPSIDSVVGYNIYRSSSLEGPFKKLNAAPINQTTFVATQSEQADIYMVRALKLEVSGSGSYYNLSQGSFVTVPGELLAQTAPQLTTRAEISPYAVALHSAPNALAPTNGIPEITGRGPNPELHGN